MPLAPGLLETFPDRERELRQRGMARLQQAVSGNCFPVGLTPGVDLMLSARC
jgi:hypothetical protein